MFGRRPSPDPWFGPPIELGGRHAPRLVLVGCTAEILTGQRCPAKEPPPAPLQVQPTGFRRNKDQVDPGMLGQPGMNGWALVAGEFVILIHKADDRDRRSGFVMSHPSLATWCPPFHHCTDLTEEGDSTYSLCAIKSSL